MSISLALVPVALVLRAVMGKEKFNSWVNSAQIKIPSNFKDESDLIVTLKKAGFDSEKMGAAVKTHIKGEKEFFFWDLIEGKWTAIFSKYDSGEIIRGFINDLEVKSGRKLFNSSSISSDDNVYSNNFPTNFRDKDLLIKTLQEFGVNPIRELNDEIFYSINSIQLKFVPTDNGFFNVEIIKNSDMEYIFKILSLIDKDYRGNVQKATYKHLKEKIQQKGFAIENEEILEDNSILITIQM